MNFLLPPSTLNLKSNLFFCESMADIEATRAAEETTLLLPSQGDDDHNDHVFVVASGYIAGKSSAEAYALARESDATIRDMAPESSSILFEVEPIPTNITNDSDFGPMITCTSTVHAMALSKRTFGGFLPGPLRSPFKGASWRLMMVTFATTAVSLLVLHLQDFVDVPPTLSLVVATSSIIALLYTALCYSARIVAAQLVSLEVLLTIGWGGVLAWCTAKSFDMPLSKTIVHVMVSLLGVCIFLLTDAAHVARPRRLAIFPLGLTAGFAALYALWLLAGAFPRSFSHTNATSAITVEGFFRLHITQIAQFAAVSLIAFSARMFSRKMFNLSDTSVLTIRASTATSYEYGVEKAQETLRRCLRQAYPSTTTSIGVSGPAATPHSNIQVSREEEEEEEPPALLRQKLVVKVAHDDGEATKDAVAKVLRELDADATIALHANCRVWVPRSGGSHVYNPTSITGCKWAARLIRHPWWYYIMPIQFMGMFVAIFLLDKLECTSHVLNVWPRLQVVLTVGFQIFCGYSCDILKRQAKRLEFWYIVMMLVLVIPSSWCYYRDKGNSLTVCVMHTLALLCNCILQGGVDALIIPRPRYQGHNPQKFVNRLVGVTWLFFAVYTGYHLFAEQSLIYRNESFRHNYDLGIASTSIGSIGQISLLSLLVLQLRMAFEYLYFRSDMILVTYDTLEL